MATAAIFNHVLTAGRALNGQAAPTDGTTNGTNGAQGSSGSSGSSGSDSTSGDSATISANDFLTLLVTEMQNQDPTADTDPNEYIDQLVQVNSLEQLIDINQTLSGAVGSSTTDSGDGASSQVAAIPNGAAGASPAPAIPAAHQRLAEGAAPVGVPTFSAASFAATTGKPPRGVPGNLGVPGASAAAQRVGHALNGRGHLKPIKGSAIALQ